MGSVTTCASPGCVAITVAGYALCAVHQAYCRRGDDDAAIVCVACGKAIRIGAQWVCRGEGAIHARAACLKKSPADYSRVPHWPRGARKPAAARASSPDRKELSA